MLWREPLASARARSMRSCWLAATSRRKCPFAWENFSCRAPSFGSTSRAIVISACFKKRRIELPLELNKITESWQRLNDQGLGQLQTASRATGGVARHGRATAPRSRPERLDLKGRFCARRAASKPGNRSQWQHLGDGDRQPNCQESNAQQADHPQSHQNCLRCVDLLARR